MGSKNTPAGSTTQTTTAAPWGPQQPYIESGLSAAQGLYNTGGPQYYPGQAYAPETPAMGGALQDLSQLGGAGAIDPNLISQNELLTLQNNANFLSGYNAAANPANANLANAAGQNYSDVLNGTVVGNQAYGGVANPGAAELANQAYGGIANPGTAALIPYASGQYVNGGASNPYTAALAQNVLSNVVPSIESQFIQGGDLSSPEAAYATAQGAANALAPSLFGNFQTQEQLQQQAGTTLGSQALQGAGLQQQAASTLGSQGLQGQGLEQSAAGLLGNQAVAGQNAQANAATAQSNSYNQGTQQQLAASALAPQTEGLPANLLQDQYTAGVEQQAQNQLPINAAMQQWNYNQTLPWQNLNEYIGQTTGNYGGATTATQPFYQNTGANLASGALGGAMLGNSLFGSGGLLAGSGVSSGVGKGLGSLLGAGLAFSDRRLKEDVRRIAELPNGLAVYSFRYLDDPEIHIGFMADEVEVVRPAAVTEGELGFKMVDSARAMV